MSQCKECGSFAINHKLHGRDGSDGDLCDVCYWRKRAQTAVQFTAQSGVVAWMLRDTTRPGSKSWPTRVGSDAYHMASAHPNFECRPLVYGDVQKAEAVEQSDELRRFLDVAAGEGYVFDGVDAGDLFLKLFPDTFTHN